MRLRLKQTLGLLALLCAVPMLQAAQCIPSNVIPGPVDRVSDSVDRINDTLSRAVDALSAQSSSWQATLLELESSLAADASTLERQFAADASTLERQLVRDVHGLVDHVHTVAQDGLQFTQESVNCQKDIFAGQARVEIQNLLIELLNKYSHQGRSDRPKVPQVPIVCSANPSIVNLGEWTSDTLLTLSGSNLSLFDSQKPSIVVVKSNHTESVIDSAMGNRVTNYRYTLNIPAMIHQHLLEDALQLQVRWNGHQVNQNEIAVTQCGARGEACCLEQCDSPLDACVNLGRTNRCTACGASGQPCCAGATCGNGGTCVNNTCTPCGTAGSACCPGNSCSVGNCSNGTCQRHFIEHFWSQNNSQPTLMGSSDSQVCFLTGMKGRFKGAGELIETAILSHTWYLQGHSGQAEVEARAGCLGGHPPLREFEWSQGMPKVRMEAVQNNACFLTQVVGKFMGGGERVEITEENGHYYLGGSSLQSGVGAKARCVGNTVRKHKDEWTQGSPTKALGQEANQVCFLTRVTGRFEGRGESVHVYVANGSWYLGGSSGQNEVGASAVCVAW